MCFKQTILNGLGNFRSGSYLKRHTIQLSLPMLNDYILACMEEYFGDPFMCFRPDSPTSNASVNLPVLCSNVQRAKSNFLDRVFLNEYDDFLGFCTNRDIRIRHINSSFGNPKATRELARPRCRKKYINAKISKNYIS
uniref:Uncharacterized protein n=1 Tax=Tetranychus urticae TaxID=32264 RepID=T1JYC4_TETUR